jgi:hypothetical protein
MESYAPLCGCIVPSKKIRSRTENKEFRKQALGKVRGEMDIKAPILCSLRRSDVAVNHVMNTESLVLKERKRESRLLNRC